MRWNNKRKEMFIIFVRFLKFAAETGLNKNDWYGKGSDKLRAWYCMSPFCHLINYTNFFKKKICPMSSSKQFCNYNTDVCFGGLYGKWYEAEEKSDRKKHYASLLKKKVIRFLIKTGMKEK